MTNQVVWKKLSVTDQTDPNHPVEHILPKGAQLPDWVDSFTVFALTSAGAIRAVDQLDPSLLADLAGPDPVLMPEHAPGVGRFDEPGYGLEHTSVGGLAASPDAEVVDHTTVEGRAELARQMQGGAAERRAAGARTPAERTPTGPAAGTGAGLDRPTDGASVADWRAYAKSRATNDEERAKIDGTTKAELITNYG